MLPTRSGVFCYIQINLYYTAAAEWFKPEQNPVLIKLAELLKVIKLFVYLVILLSLSNKVVRKTG